MPHTCTSDRKTGIQCLCLCHRKPGLLLNQDVSISLNMCMTVWQTYLAATATAIAMFNMLLSFRVHSCSPAIQCKVLSGNIFVCQTQFTSCCCFKITHTVVQYNARCAQWWHLYLSNILRMLLLQNHTCSCALQCKVRGVDVHPNHTL